MKKDNMLRWLSCEFDSWNEVYSYYGRNRSEVTFPCCFGWYIDFDGPSVGEMYLTNKHPSSDLSGEVITISEFNEVKT